MIYMHYLTLLLICKSQFVCCSSVLGRKLTPGLPSETFLAVYLFLESSSISLQTGQTGKLCPHSWSAFKTNHGVCWWGGINLGIHDLQDDHKIKGGIAMAGIFSKELYDTSTSKPWTRQNMWSRWINFLAEKADDCLVTNLSQIWTPEFSCIQTSKIFAGTLLSELHYSLANTNLMHKEGTIEFAAAHRVMKKTVTA